MKNNRKVDTIGQHIWLDLLVYYVKIAIIKTIMLISQIIVTRHLE